MKRRKKESNLLREQERCEVFGYELERSTLLPKKHAIDLNKKGDHGCDPIGDGTFRMVPSGDVVDYAERCRRLE